jgi:release factor glutamine methyltransferase
MTVGEALAHGTNVLAEAGIDTARLEAELLLARACDDCARALLYMDLPRELTPESREAYESLLLRRARREPLAYILGHWGFRRLTLKTDKRALVPRPETEIVVERALEHLRGMDAPRVLDVGTGTGAIALAIVDEDPEAVVTAIDVSQDALALARENADIVGVNGRLRLVEHDLTEGLGNGAFDLVVSNPPYIEPEDIDTLQPEVRDWEPRIALVAHGATEAVARAATAALRPGGWVVLEIAENQADRVTALLRELGYDDVRVSPDMAGRDRVIEARWSR